MASTLVGETVAQADQRAQDRSRVVEDARLQSTLLAVERLAAVDEQSSAYSKWYEPGEDFFYYAAAQEACRESRARLTKLKLSEDERKLLSEPWEPNCVETRLKVIRDEQELKAKKHAKWQKSASEFVNDFCRVADRTSGLIQMLLPHSPEYTVPWGMLMILFKSVVTKKEQEESLNKYLQSLSLRLPLVEFYRTTFPTNAMKLAVARMFVEIVKLLDEAVIFYRNGRLSKLVDAIWQPTENKFDTYIANIETEAKKLADLKNVAHEAQATDIKDLVKDTGKVVARLYETFDRSTTAIGISMDMMNRKLNALEAKTDQMLTFEMIKYGQTLCEALLPEGWDAEEELELVLHRGFRLSPKDHWENNGVLDALLSWSKHSCSSGFWIGGKSGNQDTWVTELSADIVQALKPQLLILLYVFCNDTSFRSQPLTPIRLVKGLIIQLLSLHPHLAYQSPDSFNPWRFQRLVSFWQVWRVFEHFALSVPDLFIVLDRIEECRFDEHADLETNLLPSLSRLADSAGARVRIIITSIHDPPEDIDGPSELESIYIDTSKAPRTRR